MPIQTIFTVASETDLNNALTAIDLTGASSAPNTAYTITLNSGLTGANALQLTAALHAINLAQGDTLTIQGNGDTIDGGGSQRGLFVYSGKVTVENLTLANMTATGGNGFGNAGGGAGLGGRCSSPTTRRITRPARAPAR
jgi:hypothetical protein